VISVWIYSSKNKLNYKFV